MTKQWKIETASDLSEELNNLLEDGWEPFAVAPGNVDFFYLRKEVYVVAPDGFVEGQYITNPCNSEGANHLGPNFLCELSKEHTGPHMALDGDVQWAMT